MIFPKYKSADQGIERSIRVVDSFQESSLMVSVNGQNPSIYALEQTLHPISKHLAPTSSIKLSMSAKSIPMPVHVDEIAAEITPLQRL